MNEGPDDKTSENRVLGEFRILRRLGKGGMAEVFLAEQTSLHRCVAVKVLRTELLSNETNLQRFEQEAKAAGGLNHPNIVQIYTVGEHNGTHYIAQEYVDGMNLREFLNRKGPPRLAVALRIMKQVAAALQAAAEAGIVHRDIKPENILINRKGEAKVADFGLAQLSLGEERVNLTQVGTTMGTPLYMSPEQVQGKQLDHRSDIYSFGVTCYHILLGRPPFQGETALSVAVQHLNDTPVALQEARPDLLPALCAIVHKMMAKWPQQRYADARSIIQDLKRLSQSIEKNPQADAVDIAIGELKPATSTVSAKTSSRWSPGLLWVVFLMVCLVVGGSFAAIGWWLRPQNPLQTPAATLPPQTTIEEQFDFAQILGDDEDAWRAVMDYSPGNLRYQQLAKVQLGVLYLRTLQYDDAKNIFDELAALGDDELKAKGWAGIAVLAALQGDHEQSRQLIETRLSTMRAHLDPESELAAFLSEADDQNHFERQRRNRKKGQ